MTIDETIRLLAMIRALDARIGCGTEDEMRAKADTWHLYLSTLDYAQARLVVQHWYDRADQPLITVSHIQSIILRPTYQTRKHPMPLPECANCQTPYRRDTRMVGMPCVKCGEPLVLYQHDPNARLPKPDAQTIAWDKERFALLGKIYKSVGEFPPDVAEQAMKDLIDEQHNRAPF